MRRRLILGGAAITVAAAAAALMWSGAAPPAAIAPATYGTTRGTTDGATDGAATIPAAADAARGAAVFSTCSACHTVGRGGADVDGPNLYGVVGSRVAGRRPRYGYTQSLRDVGGAWTADRLNAWLTDPAAFAPGTAMHFPGLPDAQDRADVIAFLQTQGSPQK